MSSARQQDAGARAVRNRGAFGIRRFLLVCAVALAPAAAHAGAASDTFEVTATVLATCEVSAQDLAFGNYDPIASAHLDAATTLSVTCTSGTPYQIGLSLGDGSGASTATRYMTQGSDTLGYALYQDSARTTVWGETLNGNTRAGVGSGAAAVIDVYGRVPMHQSAPAGPYSDTIVVTVTW